MRRPTGRPPCRSNSSCKPKEDKCPATAQEITIFQPGNPVVTNTTITSSWANGTLTDVGTALTQSLSKDGQTTATGNLPLGGFHLTGLGNGTARTDSANIGQIQDEVFVWGGTASGSATAMSIITSPATTAYVAGQVYKFIAVATNTGALTLAVNALAATAVTQGGSTPLVAGDVLIGQVVEVVFDGTRFQLLNPASVQAGSVFRKNVIINGNFDVWQRGTSLAAGAATRYLADRFATGSSGSTVAPSQQAFTLGQTTVPGEPAYFHRTVVASVAAAGNYALFAQPYRRRAYFCWPNGYVSLLGQRLTQARISHWSSIRALGLAGHLRLP